MLSLLALACAPSDPASTPVDTDDTEVPPTPVVRCDLPVAPFALGPPLAAPRANRSLVIEGDALIGWNGSSLIRATSPTDAELFVPNITAFGGMQFVGETLFLSEHLGAEDVLAIEPDGSRRIVATGLRAYGLVLGPDGWLWLTAEPDTIYRLNPADNELQRVVDFPEGVLPRVSDFSPAGDRLYVGTRNEQGTVWALDLDDQHAPVGDPYVFATTSGTFHDLLVVDACGELLVTAYYGRGVFRITPEGVVTTIAELPEVEHLHGAAWGSGIGAWDDHTLYLAQPNAENVVVTWEIGRPGRAFRGGDYLRCGLADGPECSE